MRKLAFVSLLALPMAAMAEVPAAVTTAITAGGTDGTALVTALAVAGAAVFILKKLLSRFGLSL
jgi:hypothetical protein